MKIYKLCYTTPTVSENEIVGCENLNEKRSMTAVSRAVFLFNTTFFGNSIGSRKACRSVSNASPLFLTLSGCLLCENKKQQVIKLVKGEVLC